MPPPCAPSPPSLAELAVLVSPHASQGGTLISYLSPILLVLAQTGWAITGVVFSYWSLTPRKSSPLARRPVQTQCVSDAVRVHGHRRPGSQEHACCHGLKYFLLVVPVLTEADMQEEKEGREEGGREERKTF